ncbi:DUF1016 N-terminal domain-containing protein [Legionella birminghamensis]|nr:DUF1016 N-terminal domain-containing protein [Legionella birminghamensis]
MPKNLSNASSLQLNLSYQNLLTDIKERLKKAQIRAAITVNHELIKFYWEVGNLIIQEQKNARWGVNIIE